MDRLQKTADALQKHGFQVQILDTGADAKEAALALIGTGSVGFGGSMTVSDLGIYETLQKRGNKLYWHWKVPPEERAALFPPAAAADTYICSTNAILESGALLNIDGNANRVAAMVSGPKQLVVIAGQNKLCGDYEDALQRIKREACPPNAKRLGLQTPCGVTGKCTDCTSPQRFCNATVLLERPAGVKNIHILLVKEDLGY